MQFLRKTLEFILIKSGHETNREQAPSQQAPAGREAVGSAPDPDKRMVLLEVEVEALKRRHERDQAEVARLADRIARQDTSGALRELQAENVRLKQRVADLEVYIAVRAQATV